MIFFVNATNWIENQDFRINFKKFDVYNIKDLCHHVQHILLYFWLKYKSIWTNIYILILIIDKIGKWAVFQDI